MMQFKGKVDTAYLDLLKIAMQRDKERSFELLDLVPGSAMLEVGCGPATDTLALAALVGPGGRVVGVDFDPEMIALANARAEEAGLEATVSHQVGDAMALPFSDGTFDACRCERVFQHLPDPAGALAEMIRVTRPGGRAVVIDTDHHSRAVDTSERDVLRRLTDYFCANMVTSPWAARALYRLMREAGLTEVTVEPRSLVIHDLAFLRHAGLLDALEREAVDAGAVSEDEVTRFRTDLEAAAANATLFGYVTVIYAAGTKPAA
jgi:ubiquinone/menaquinone biosynthesis C-methylase UbiE